MCRRCGVALVLAVVAALSAAPAQAQSETGAQLVTATADESKNETPRPALCAAATLVCIGKTVVGTVGGIVGGVAGDAIGAGTSAAGSAAMSGVVSWAAEGAAWLVGEVAKAVERSSRPELGDPWFKDRYDGMQQLAVVFVALFLLLAIGHAIVAQDLARLLRAAFVVLPCAAFLTFTAVTLTQIALRATDEMTAWIVGGTRDDMREAFGVVAEALAPNGSTLAPFVLFLSATLTAFVALLIWLELVMREAAIYVAVAFLPLTLAASVWERTAHWSRRLAEWLLAIILAKFTIAAAFALAASAITGGVRESGGLSAVLAGCAVLLIAALTPWALIRMLPFAEAAAMRSLTPRHATNAIRSVPGSGTAAFATRQLAFRQFGSMVGQRSGGAPTTATAGTPTLALALRSASQKDPATPADLPQLPPKEPRGRRRERDR